LPSGRDARGRMTTLPPALRARQWASGQSGNPSGRGGLYHEVQRLAREASPGAVQRLIELAQLDRVDEEGKLLPLTADADPRVVMMASSTLIERGFGKPRDDYDPKADEPPRPRFNPALYTAAQLAQIEAALRLVAAAQDAEAEAQTAG
jgi:hypothetical protein